ncbi:copper exporting ATPase [Stieleria maiorica]|uniref:Copper exporting ATPase n=1 Tax=Stieleria maiorica TaxID=2795974 RepID=A0A5B9MLZ6_9BACT|nr:cation transporter [Stieleria maiorica]QEG00655.1 copper exporting ATPase [Stieleria maiorica]
MIHRIVLAFVSAAAVLLVAPRADAEVSVTISKMHLCCGACVKGVEGALEKVEGASVKADQKSGTAVLTAEDAKTARRALGAIARAGFHGDTDHAKLKIKDNSGVKQGTTKRLELVGIHNCCAGCNKAIKAAIASVEGVQADTAKAKRKTLVVEGEFDGLALVQALNKAGFHVRAKGAAQEAAAKRKQKADGDNTDQ